MAYVSPYQTAGVQSNLLETLIQSKLKEKEGAMEGGIQKSEMITEYGSDIRDKVAKINEASRKASGKKRKRKWWEKVAPILAMLIPGIGPGVAAGITGLTTGYGASKDASFAERTAQNLQKHIEGTPLAGYGSARKGIDPWKGTFLSEKAADFKSGRLEKAADLDTVIASAKDAGKFSNVFGQALSSALMTYGMKEAMQGGGDLGEVGKMGSDILGGGSTFNVTDILGELGKGPLESLFSGGNIGSMLLGEEGEPRDAASLQMLLSAIGALQD